MVPFLAHPVDSLSFSVAVNSNYYELTLSTCGYCVKLADVGLR